MPVKARNEGYLEMIARNLFFFFFLIFGFYNSAKKEFFISQNKEWRLLRVIARKLKAGK